jgi:electron transport complex protein RnfD
MRFQTDTSPHVFVGDSVPRIMRRVLHALVPGIAVLIWFFGWGVVFQIAIASAVAIVAEAAMLALRNRPVRLFVTDGSALVTAWLLAIALPGLAPWWLTVMGTLFSVVVAKHLYGGLGYNPFNPAMIGYVVLLISFPLEMSTWPAAYGLSEAGVGFLETGRYIFTGQLPAGVPPDALTGATALDALKTQLGRGVAMADIGAEPTFGLIAGQGWEWASLAFLAGGLWLVFTRAAAWQIPASMLASLGLIAAIFHGVDPEAHASAWFHLLGGATVYGAFFIATDPVSASTTPRGRLVFGAGIGLLTYLLRNFGGFPDGLAFAVLLMNITAPTIDYYTQPRVFGARRP